MSAFTTAAHSLLDPFLARAEGVEGTWGKAADAVRTRWAACRRWLNDCLRYMIVCAGCLPACLLLPAHHQQLSIAYALCNMPILPAH
jgi:hypothetical protein